jgi:hypothetical protein
MMHSSMAISAKRNQIAHHVPTELTPWFHVMDLQVFHGTALLTAPTIAFQHSLSKEDIIFWIQSEPWSFAAWTYRVL